MSFYSDYLNANLNFDAMQVARKDLLRTISSLRDGRDIMVYASDLSKKAPNMIEYSDILAFQDQLANLSGSGIDIILETPGGFAEVVEDIVKLLRQKYESIGIIIPGYSKSAGTIFAMAWDEILMGPLSALWPIDAQILANGKQFSAEAFLDGLEKIKLDVSTAWRLNPAYIPILQNISPWEIQHCENAQGFSKKLVSEWLVKYKFKFWHTHSSTWNPVTPEDKNQRAEQIARLLCSHSNWLTHGRSIKKEDLEEMRLKITDYSLQPELNEAIMRYYTLTRIMFEQTAVYKLFETPLSQIYRLIPTTSPSLIPQLHGAVPEHNKAVIRITCPRCGTNTNVQANLQSNILLETGAVPYPVATNVFICPSCWQETNVNQIRLQIEAQSGKMVVA